MEELLGYLWNSAAAARMGQLLRCACRTWRPRWALEQEADNSAWELRLSSPWHPVRDWGRRRLRVLTPTSSRTRIGVGDGPGARPGFLGRRPLSALPR